MLGFVAFLAPLGFDSLAVAIALGLRGMSPWRPAIVFASFETLTPIVGIVAGRLAGARFEGPAEIVGGAVLICVGIHAVREAMEGDDETEGLSFASLRAAATAGLAISTDELAVGFPLGAAHLPIAPVLIAIGLQAFIVAVVGIAIGRRIGAALGTRATRYAGFAAGFAFGAVGIWLIAAPFFAR